MNEYLTTEELCGFTEPGFEDEQWGVIPGYENYYVSTKGRIWSVNYGNFLKQCTNEHGYPIVRLWSNGEGRTVKIHRVEGLVFIPNPDNLPVIRHLNDVETDNRVENLAWGTQADNMNDAIINGCLDNMLRPVIAINNDTGIGYYYESCSEASRDLGCSDASVGDAIIHGKNICGYRIEDADLKYLHEGIKNGNVVRHLFPIRKMKRPGNSTKVLCTRCEDGEQLIFENIIETVKFFDSPYKTISEAIRGKHIHKGYHIEYVY